MLETALSLNWCVSATWNTAVILMLTAVCDVQSRVISPTAVSLSLISFGAVMGVSLGLTAAHGVGLRVVCWCFVDNSIVAFALSVELK